MLEYREPLKITKQEALKVFSTGSKDKICEALVGIAFYVEDWKWCQNQFLYFFENEDLEIKRVAAICLGHLARLHGHLDKGKVLEALNKHLQNEEIAGTIEDALSDIAMFLK